MKNKFKPFKVQDIDGKDEFIVTDIRITYSHWDDCISLRYILEKTKFDGVTPVGFVEFYKIIK